MDVRLINVTGAAAVTSRIAYKRGYDTVTAACGGIGIPH